MVLIASLFPPLVRMNTFPQFTRREFFFAISSQICSFGRMSPASPSAIPVSSENNVLSSLILIVWVGSEVFHLVFSLGHLDAFRLFGNLPIGIPWGDS